MIILIDQDGPITDLEGAFHQIWREERPDAPHVLPAERTTFYLRADYPHKLRAHVDEILHRPGFFTGLPVVAGSLDALRAMVQAGHEVFICTSPLQRAAHCASEKIAWVRTHLGDEWVDRVVLTRDKTLVRGDVLIDDRPEMRGLLPPTWTHVLWDAPYNRESPVPGRLAEWRDWPQILPEA